jgi:hypothetical protein
MRDRITKRYLNAYGALYGEGQITLPKKRSKSLIPLEREEQEVVKQWLEKMNIIFYHIPNGGKRTVVEGVILKRMGVKAGIPDFCIPMARKGYHGLYGELKRRKGGVISVQQAYWLSELTKQGYYVFVAHGADEFIQQVKNYMES